MSRLSEAEMLRMLHKLKVKMPKRVMNIYITCWASCRKMLDCHKRDVLLICFR
ncbi:hypothetical protein GCM10007183_12220 [Staphylococcus muscae]|uniref:Uncharacterized protein n=1 Tax=Staphylococcus muscae TaxID=1294 RepID=A0ABQ1HUM3_9STAP|nr:hypothetical protein GCM10007183_12220 [Staphylococcus muscae]